MKRIQTSQQIAFPTRLLFALAVAGLGAAQSGCPATASALVVETLEALSITAQSTTAPGSCTTGQPISEGTIDIERGGCCGYSVGVEMINNLPSQTDTNTPPLTVNEHNVTLTNVTVSYQFIPDGNGPTVTIPEANMPVSAVLLSGGSSEQFIAPVLTTSNGSILNPSGGQPVVGGIVATMTFHGATTDGTPIASSPVVFPITVCDGCLGPVICPGGEVQTCTADSLDQSDGAICVTLTTADAGVGTADAGL